jgi:hypothetical protein
VQSSGTHSMPLCSADALRNMYGLHRATVLLLELTLARSLKSLLLKRYIHTLNTISYYVYTIYYTSLVLSTIDIKLYTMC